LRIAGERCLSLEFCGIEEEGFFTVPYLQWHEAAVFAAGSDGPHCLVTDKDKHEVLGIYSITRTPKVKGKRVDYPLLSISFKGASKKL
jgi:hypothetical protein